MKNCMLLKKKNGKIVDLRKENANCKDCSKCGWNPKVAKKRMEKLNNG